VATLPEDSEFMPGLQAAAARRHRDRPRHRDRAAAAAVTSPTARTPPRSATGRGPEHGRPAQPGDQHPPRTTATAASPPDSATSPTSSSPAPGPPADPLTSSAARSPGL
jgi:hypothetical protein